MDIRFKTTAGSFATPILFWCSLVVVSAVNITIPLIPLFAETFTVFSSQAAWVGSAFSFALQAEDYSSVCYLIGLGVKS
ncbi:hypothetical protein ACFQ3J_25305 [Paenibacillus provencensis]|uniref:MFS transporter n=1 Tax=Paenibacillus provencensis TaxID=441151 RepID=A0ABW3PZB3_9BACL|nr:hypothetical protein [Paenibacillus sp. MER 78]MCM3130712.1 hypothetical protein [Paenibacillus sp. MER 78]